MLNIEKAEEIFVIPFISKNLNEIPPLTSQCKYFTFIDLFQLQTSMYFPMEVKLSAVIAFGDTPQCTQGKMHCKTWD